MALEGTAPLARTTSMSSCAGYHTPIEDEVAGDGVSDLPSDIVPTSRGGSLLNAQVVLFPYLFLVDLSFSFKSQSMKSSFFRLRLQVQL